MRKAQIKKIGWLILEAKQFDAVIGGSIDEIIFIEEDDAAGLKCSGLNTALLHHFKGARTEDRDIEAVVLCSLNGFNKDEIFGFKTTGSLKHGVGAFIGFDCEDGAFTNHATLADIEFGGTFSDLDAVLEVFRGCL